MARFEKYPLYFFHPAQQVAEEQDPDSASADPCLGALDDPYFAASTDPYFGELTDPAMADPYFGYEATDVDVGEDIRCNRNHVLTKEIYRSWSDSIIGSVSTYMYELQRPPPQHFSLLYMAQDELMSEADRDLLAKFSVFDIVVPHWLDEVPQDIAFSLIYIYIYQYIYICNTMYIYIYILICYL